VVEKVVKLVSHFRAFVVYVDHSKDGVVVFHNIEDQGVEVGELVVGKWFDVVGFIEFLPYKCHRFAGFI
jgi:hypothetical protein